ncbi:enoyl-ACP reductase FabI [Actinosynnema pretiosum subsp. pretiosum]|uniref:Enoyl-[acyl-carrier-protein] reductase [NADH] n=3 Tax=Actinosynnema TaxID=40566 RepID=C6WPH6_ACTMD|nr:enoyl-ACP reductase FabI [Actinosynnema mirum]ACU38678.1 short-chain dehydrogenase/reductase SDR [Actinosynnema mirum DSM 43827]AXX32274.1 Enoyl-[acyl-carrier-protein] reductase [NADH] [Actinosynnema pretiosum subsp. pretiosum]QUF03777.1 enoyl-ACP reductase FabI [Actinosynnema pretiosum subsp. pretiosum]
MLKGKTVLVTGVITTASIAFHVAKHAQEAGARVVLTGYGRLSLVERMAARLPEPAPVLELDVTDERHLATLADRVGEHADRLDGVLHSIAYAPPSALGGGFLDTAWPDVATTLRTSTYSLQALTTSVLPLLRRGSDPAVVGLDFDASVAWPDYDWMGVAKAGLEATARYLARYLGPHGVRVNLVAAGPLRTTAAGAVTAPGRAAPPWADNAPLGWDEKDAGPAARACVALLSDWFPATTGEIVHVDGGAHAMGG